MVKLHELPAILAMILAWYAASFAYNTYNRKIMEAFPLPYTVGVIQIGAGIPIVGVFWVLGVQPPPQLSNELIKKVSPLAMIHLAAHICALVSFGTAQAPLVNAVRAAEPIVTVAIARLFGVSEAPQIELLLPLLPLSAGIAIMSAKGAVLARTALWTAGTANVAAASRWVIAKEVMLINGMPRGAALFNLVTIAAFLLALPFALVAEGSDVTKGWRDAMERTDEQTLLKWLAISGITYYLHHEIAFRGLQKLTALSVSAASVSRRVATAVVASVLKSRPLQGQAAFGSMLAAAGAAGYAVAAARKSAAVKPERRRQ